MVSFVNVIPSQLSTVLFALAPGDEADLHLQVRKTMRICLVISVVTAPLFVIFAPLILRIFGHDYVTAAAALAILGFATYPQTIKAHYVAIARVRGRMQSAALWTLVGGCLEVGFAAVGAIKHGLTGLAVAYLIAATIEAIFFCSLGLWGDPQEAGFGCRNPDRVRRVQPCARRVKQRTMTKERVTVARIANVGLCANMRRSASEKLGGFQHG